MVEVHNVMWIDYIAVETWFSSFVFDNEVSTFFTSFRCVFLVILKIVVSIFLVSGLS